MTLDYDEIDTWFTSLRRALDKVVTPAVMRRVAKSEPEFATRRCTIYSILAGTLFRPRIIGFSDCVLLRLGIMLQRDG